METSGGEGQKIAIARALYHNSPFFILDEPTASLDPISEYDIYKNFHESIKDRGAILVTHRLSAVQLADKVAVFQDGAVVEYGTHTDLYAKEGIYKKMSIFRQNFILMKQENNKYIVQSISRRSLPELLNTMFAEFMKCALCVKSDFSFSAKQNISRILYCCRYAAPTRSHIIKTAGTLALQGFRGFFVV